MKETAILPSRRLFVARLAGRHFGPWHQRLYHGKEGAFLALDVGRYRLGWWYRPRRFVCPNCDGTGEVATPRTCGGCGGTGRKNASPADHREDA